MRSRIFAAKPRRQGIQVKHVTLAPKELWLEMFAWWPKKCPLMLTLTPLTHSPCYQWVWLEYVEFMMVAEVVEYVTYHNVWNSYMTHQKSRFNWLYRATQPEEK